MNPQQRQIYALLTLSGAPPAPCDDCDLVLAVYLLQCRLYRTVRRADFKATLTALVNRIALPVSRPDWGSVPEDLHHVLTAIAGGLNTRQLP